MSLKSGILLGVLGGVALTIAGSAPAELLGQAFAGSGSPAGLESGAGAAGPTAAGGGAMAADAVDSALFASGTRAINESRWADAVKIFTEVAGQHGEHADGALYWKADAEYELGQSKPAEETCAELRAGYPSSRWIDDCGALEVEIRARDGKPVAIDPTASDDVKLLALNAMMRQNEARALAEIQAILSGDSSEKLKKAAQSILGQHYSDETYAQIVRISYVEGDVRIQRGEPNAKAGNAPWEKAIADLPIETGFSLVTGEGGRAEIEFENASTIYLGENSVLTFNDLHETAGVPFTELGLLTGTVSLHIHPYVAGERFVLHTQTEDLVSKFPDKTYARVETYTDAISLTPLEGGELRLPGVPKDQVEPGRTWTYQQGQLWAEDNPEDDAAPTAWDKWVADRVASRDAAIASVMQASGLPQPIPGMAGMAGKGKFFDCAPYGTCWEPNDFAGEEDTAHYRSTPTPSRRSEGQPQLVLASFHPSVLRPFQAQVKAQAQAGPQEHIIPLEFFPCGPGAIRYQLPRDIGTGGITAMDGSFVQDRDYDWAVCHAGTWIRHRKHYVWVAGCKRHHIDPVRWVKSDHKVAFVPLHPYDVKGQPPINARHEVFEVSGKGTVIVQPVKFEPNRPIEFLKEAPKEFRNEPMLQLARVDAPHMEAHAFARTSVSKVSEAAKGVEVSRGGVPIHFDLKAQTFTMPRTEIHGGKATTTFAPISNRTGSLQARGGSGFHGGASGATHGGGSFGGSGGSAHGGSSSASSGGGGSHGGGASSGGSSGGGASSGGGGGGSHH